MLKLSQRGAIQYIILIILVAGLVAGLYLVQKTQIFKPKATVSGPIIPTTSFTLSSSKQQLNVGDEILVQILVHSDIAATNLFAAKINYDPQVLQLGWRRTIGGPFVDVRSTFIKNWVEQDWADPGKISLVGGVPSPGFQTQVSDNPVMATIQFTALKAGTTTISFDETSAIYSNADNANILVAKNPVTLSISSGIVVPTPQPSVTPSLIPTVTPSPTPYLTPVAIPVPDTGDGNNDGKTNLVDLSILLSDFNKAGGFRRGIDLNGDGKINTFDFSLMRNLLIQKGVIKG